MRGPVYHVNAQSDGALWYVDVPAIAGATQARSLDEVDVMAKDYIAETIGGSPDEVEIRVTITR